MSHILFFAKESRNLRQHFPGMCEICGCNIEVSVLHRHHRIGSRLAPLTVINTRLNCVILCTTFQKGIPVLHHFIIFLQYTNIPILTIHCHRHDNAGISPADRTCQHRSHEASFTVRRCDICHLTFRILSVTTLRQPFSIYIITIHQHQTRIDIKSRISCPRCSLTSRAVGRHITEVALLTPFTIPYQLVHICISTCEVCCLFHL